MADPIDNDFFEQDIKPLRDTYGLNRRESSYITSLEDRDMQPHLQTMLRLRSQLVQERNADLAYQTGLFEFEEKKKKAREEVDYADRTTQATKDISDIVEDDTKDPNQKLAEMARFTAANAALFSKSPTARLILSSGESAIKSQAAQRASADKNGESLSRVATQGISPAEFEKSINADGVVTDMEKNFRLINSANYAKSQKSNEYREAQAGAASAKQRELEHDADLKRALALIDEDEVFIGEIKSIGEAYEPDSTDANDVPAARADEISSMLQAAFPTEDYNTIFEAQQSIRARRTEAREKNKTDRAAEDAAGSSMVKTETTAEDIDARASAVLGDPKLLKAVLEKAAAAE